MLQKCWKNNLHVREKTIYNPQPLLKSYVTYELEFKFGKYLHLFYPFYVGVNLKTVQRISIFLARCRCGKNNLHRREKTIYNPQPLLKSYVIYELEFKFGNYLHLFYPFYVGVNIKTLQRISIILARCRSAEKITLMYVEKQSIVHNLC